MAVCPSCEASNPDGHSFCGQCGSPLAALTCSSCGAQNGVTQRFCGTCGLALDGAAAAEAGPAVEERKLATVLFADVVGFTSLAERTDHEIVARMVDAAFRQLGEVVAQHGGVVDKFMGDSVMAVFGVPVAHDDDAERAVAAALAMRDLGGDLCFSIGVNSGEVMATAIGRAGDYTVIGDTVNVAARLEKTAAPGEVLCGRLTAELARSRVRFHEHQPVVL
ncbi:MAG TPA: adenylate/guanylate cyclase domain-containing protein, partial [Acidimicrobiales bacterium]|nr:adenylate/guanylate cyclase domain-containing protein [Acidimicrobiales bacterium]